LNLLLYSVFRVGNPTNNISWNSYELVTSDDRVAWTIPLSLGDSHRGYRVLGTNRDYYRHFRYGQQQSLALESGRFFEDTFETALGYDVARQLDYKVGDEIIIAHGTGEISFSMHNDHPFTVVGILTPTGTPVDQTVHTPLEGMEAIHSGRPAGGGVRGSQSLQPTEITAFMLGLESRMAVFTLQRNINEHRGEPLLAILPGVALAELWEMMSIVENILLLISAMVLAASLLCLSTMLLSSLRERRNEIVLLRSIGMHSSSILMLIELEAIVVTLLGIAAGYLIICGLLLLGQDWLSYQYGLFISAIPQSSSVFIYLGTIMAATVLIALIPALTAYRGAVDGRVGQ
jgi:putative ABC transport system permease protein